MNDQNKWAFAFHRIKVAEDNAKNGKPGACSCSDCKDAVRLRFGPFVVLMRDRRRASRGK